LLDDAGGIEALVRVPAGLDPRRLEGRRVAVRGAGGYDEDQRLRVIRARQMAALPGARRALEVNARWWEGDRIVGR
jgi:hypothetical protein